MGSTFTAHQHDGDLGLVNMRGRIYDPKIGRFLQADPLINGIDAAGLNRYSYVRNNPLNFVDPSGFTLDRRGGPQPGDIPSGPSETPPSGSPQTAGPEPSSGGPGDSGTPGSSPSEGGPQGSPTSDGPQDWMPDRSAEQHVEAKRQGAMAQSQTTTTGGGGGPPTSGSGGSQEGAPSTTQQPTSMPQGPGSGSWHGGNTGGDSTTMPKPRGLDLNQDFMPDLTPQRAPDLNRSNQIGGGPAGAAVACAANPIECTLGAVLGPALGALLVTGAIVIGGYELWKALDQDDVPPVPDTDATGKFHGDVPRYVPAEWTTEQREEAARALERSIARRAQEQIILGEEARHRDRMREERRLLRQLRAK